MLSALFVLQVFTFAKCQLPAQERGAFLGETEPGTLGHAAPTLTFFLKPGFTNTSLSLASFTCYSSEMGQP